MLITETVPFDFADCLPVDAALKSSTGISVGTDPKSVIHCETKT